MRGMTLSLCAMVAISSSSFAGGDIIPVPVPVVLEAQESAFYLGLGIAAVSNRDSDRAQKILDATDGQDRTGNITFTAGYDYNDYVAVEGRYTTSFTKEDVIEMSGWSLFLKPQYTFEDENGEKGNFKIYALIGFGGVSMSGITSWYVDVDDTGFQYGLGASYSFKDLLDGQDISIYADYTVLARDFEGLYYKGDVKADADAYTIGIAYRF